MCNHEFAGFSRPCGQCDSFGVVKIPSQAKYALDKIRSAGGGRFVTHVQHGRASERPVLPVSTPHTQSWVA